MTDIHTRKLCTEIIHWHFGPFASELTSILLTRGRLRLAQLIHLSKLKPRTARACILVLIQQNILWHSKEDDDTEVFEINMDECLMRLRFGRFIWLSQQLFGQIAAEIVQVILDHGKLRSSDVRHLLHICENKKISQYNQIFRKLVTGLYLKPSTVLSHESLRDRLMQYETEERRKITGFPTAKELRQAKEIAVTRLRSEQEKEEQIGLKRKARDQSGPRPNKRKTLDTEEIVDDNVYFRVNYEKFNIHIRNLLIEHAVKERYNKGASTVVNAILKTTEAEQLKLSEPRTPPISLTNIMMQIPEDAHFADGLVYSSKKKPTSTYVKDYLGMLSSADNPSPDGRSSSFISYSTSKVQVEFELIARRLRRNVVEAVAREKHGAEGVRIVRLLLSTEKLDEKQISKMVMMAPKDVRPLLAGLSADSLISIQEVPKSADRNPTRTFYLWYIDLQKASSFILDNVYKTLHNIIARRRAEREFSQVSAVLEKRQRSDVSQDENLLTRLEREVLQSWEAKEERLVTIGIRVEEIVFILKDLASLCSNE